MADTFDEIIGGLDATLPPELVQEVVTTFTAMAGAFGFHFGVELTETGAVLTEDDGRPRRILLTAGEHAGTLEVEFVEHDGATSAQASFGRFAATTIARALVAQHVNLVAGSAGWG